MWAGSVSSRLSDQDRGSQTNFKRSRDEDADGWVDLADGSKDEGDAAPPEGYGSTTCGRVEFELSGGVALV